MCSLVAGVFMWRKKWSGKKKTQLSGNSQSVSRPTKKDGETQKVGQSELCAHSVYCLFVNHVLGPWRYSQCCDSLHINKFIRAFVISQRAQGSN